MSYQGPEEYRLGLCPTWASAVVRDPTLKAGPKLVLLVLAQFMAPAGTFAWPGKARLAELCGVEEAQVTKSLKVAREAGWLSYYNDKSKDIAVYAPCIPLSVKDLLPVGNYDLLWEVGSGTAMTVLKLPAREDMSEVITLALIERIYDAVVETTKNMLREKGNGNPA